MENATSPSATNSGSSSSAQRPPSMGSGSNGSDNAAMRGVGTAGAALHGGIDKVADPVKNAVDNFSSAAHDTVEKVASTAADTVDRFSEQARRLTEAPSRALETSKSWVQDKPLEAVGAALALGFIVGRLTAR